MVYLNISTSCKITKTDNCYHCINSNKELKTTNIKN